MKTFLSLILVMFSIQAMASKTKISFTHFGHSGSSQSYYACSYVENQAVKYLKLFGAIDSEIYCSGGITSYSTPQPIHLIIKFNQPTLSGRDLAEVTRVQGDPFNLACGINVRIIRELIKVMPHVYVINKSDTCPFADSNYFYELGILR